MSTTSIDHRDTSSVHNTQINNVRYSYLIDILIFCVCICIAAIPIINIVFIVATTGANNPSNDYIFYSSFIDSIFSGTYDWRNYFKDTFIVGAHCTAFLFLIRLTLIQLTHWNIYAELFTGLIIAFAKLILLFDSLTFLVRRRSNWLLLPILAALVFSTSQINVFTYGDAALQLHLVQFGLMLGIWGLVRFQSRWLGISLMGLGGLIACYSGGGGLACWPAFLCGLVLLRFRKPLHYIAWMIAAALGVLPYIIFIVIDRQPGADPSAHMTLLNTRFLLYALGWAFTQHFDLPPALRAGIAGYILLAIGLLLLWFKRRTPALHLAAPALMIITYGVINGWLISVARGENGLAPWYTTHFIVVWIGMVGLAYALWTNRQVLPTDSPISNFLSVSITTWVITGGVVLVYIYATSNITYIDKAAYLYSRSPASASCLRNYRTAPTYCEQYLFQWGVGWPDEVATLAGPLERHQLAVFAPRQEWTLQGDFALDSVHVSQTSGTRNPFWVTDTNFERTPWSSFQHLNLVMPISSTVNWSMSLPPNLKEALLSSAMAVSTTTTLDSTHDVGTLSVYLDRAGAQSTLLTSISLKNQQTSWQPFTASLLPYAGQTVTLRLVASGNKDTLDSWGLFRYPRIDLLLDSNATVSLPTLTRFVSAPTPDDTVFDLSNARTWSKSNISSVQGQANTWTIGNDPSFTYQPPLKLCMAEYSHFYIRMAASSEIAPRAMQLFYRTSAQKPPDDSPSVFIPLLPDDDLHEYTYDLKLLEFDQNTYLTGLRLDPIGGTATSGANQIRVADFRLIRSPNPGTCTDTSAPHETRSDAIFNLNNTDEWLDSNIRPVSDVKNSWLIGNDPAFVYQPTLNICLSEYDYLLIRMAVPNEIDQRVIQIYYRLNNQPSFSEDKSLRIPIFSDSVAHDYVYDLKQLNLSQDARLAGIRFDPVGSAAASGGNQITISNFRLIRSAAPKGCSATASP